MHRKNRPPPTPVALDGLDADGVATGVDEKGRRWAVRGASPGAVVNAVGRRKDAFVLSVVSPPPDGVSPRCADFRRCGGCSLQDLPLTRQQDEKVHALVTLFAPLDAVNHGIRSSGVAYGYRDRIDLSFGTKRLLTTHELHTGVPMGGRYLGMHGAGHFDRIVPIATCHLADDDVNAVFRAMRDDLLASPLSIHDRANHVGYLRHLVLRRGDDGVLAILTTSPGEAADEAWLRANAAAWGAATVLWVVNEGVADVASGTLRAVLHGSGTLAITLSGVTFALSADAFFQVNRAGAEVLVDVVREALGAGSAGATLIDLYCGAGALSISLAGAYAHLIGIERSENAIADARRNAERLGVAAAYHAGTVEALLPGLALGPPDGPDGGARTSLHIVVDPPRVGLHPAALAALSRTDADVLVYVSCRATSLLRDGLALQSAGWRCTDWWAVDLFPQTGHVEVVARWVRNVGV